MQGLTLPPLVLETQDGDASREGDCEGAALDRERRVDGARERLILSAREASSMSLWKGATREISVLRMSPLQIDAPNLPRRVRVVRTQLGVQRGRFKWQRGSDLGAKVAGRDTSK